MSTEVIKEFEVNMDALRSRNRGIFSDQTDVAPGNEVILYPFVRKRSAHAVYCELVAVNEPYVLLDVPPMSEFTEHIWFEGDAGYYVTHGAYVIVY